MCLYPKIILNKKYTPNKKNRGVVPPIKDARVLGVPVKCGQCMECRKQIAREWQTRLCEDIRHNKNGKFVTLTFSNEAIKELTADTQIKDLKGYDRDNAIATLATRRFLERWRKKYKKSIRHWLITELGHQGTENIHMHGIVWTDESLQEVENIWKYGWVWKGKKNREKIQNYVSAKTVNYIIKYVHKRDGDHKYYKPKVLTSAGIGSGYMKRGDVEKNKYKQGETKTTYTNQTGTESAIPIYWRNKIYTEEEREKLWLEMLDKEKRYVLGEEIDISKGQEEYIKAVENARKRSRTLGYGGDSTNWQRKAYEEERRNYLTNKRIKHAEKHKAEEKEILNGIPRSNQWE